MTEQQRNGYDDDDLLQLVEAIEEMEAEKVFIRAAAAGECAGVAKRIKTKKAEAKDVGVPLSVLNGLLKRRRFERQITAIDETIPEDLEEVWLDASGQFCMFAPIEDEAEEPEGEKPWPDDKATGKPARTKADDDAEQAAGDEALKPAAVH